MYAIGVAARRSGVAIETIRYYERRGIVPLPDRAASGRRLYDDAAVARLRFVRRCRDLGFSLDDVRTLFALADGEPAACGAVRSLGERHLDEVRSRIADLRRLEAALEELAASMTQASKLTISAGTAIGR